MLYGSAALVLALAAAPITCMPATPSTANETGCLAKYNTCRSTQSGDLSANQAQCSAENDSCQKGCYDDYNTCRSTRSNGLAANQALCASDYSACLGQDPFAADGSLTIKPSSAATAAAAPASGPQKVDGKTWALHDVTRFCLHNTGCTYNWYIEADGKSSQCTITRNPGSNAASESWYDVSCGDSDYKASWGYSETPAPPFAVITIKNPSGELAWFGVPDVNGSNGENDSYGSGSYGDLGPNQVYTYN